MPKNQKETNWKAVNESMRIITVCTHIMKVIAVCTITLSLIGIISILQGGMGDGGADIIGLFVFIPEVFLVMGAIITFIVAMLAPIGKPEIKQMRKEAFVSFLAAILPVAAFIACAL